jgi:DNA-directed RNA polymerase subunit beta
MAVREVRRFGQLKDIIPIPSLVQLQANSYERFVDFDGQLEERAGNQPLNELFAEFFPIQGIDNKVEVTYHGYSYGLPQHDLQECRDLGQTYQKSVRIKVRVQGELLGDNVLEEEVHIGYMPLRIGGGEFLINGSERTIVTQIQRSPGVDFGIETATSGKKLHSCRIIPERGSWLMVENTTKDFLQVKIDKSYKVTATCFLRAINPDLSATADILRAFFATETLSLTNKKGREAAEGRILVTDILGAPAKNETGEPAEEGADGEVLAKSCELLTAGAVELLLGQGINEVEVLTEGVKQDDVLLNTLREDGTTSHQEAVQRIYTRLRPGNPVDDAKAKELFYDRFLDAARYNLGAVGRFRINRKLKLPEDEESLVMTGADFKAIMDYLLSLVRGTADSAELDDIDHLGNRRVRPIGDLLADELRSAMVKLRRAVKERLARDVQNEDITVPLQPRQLFNSQAVESSINNFFQRGELSQVVDQSNMLSQLTHERRLSALGPGGLNRKRAGFEVRDVHTSHYGRICPIETPEGANIGLIVSMALYSTLNEFGFLVTPYRKVEDGKVTDEIIYLMADEESDHLIAQASLQIAEDGSIDQDICQVRSKGQFTEASKAEVTAVDVSAKQMLGVSAALIPFLEHDDANRALMGANMMRQAVPLLKTDPPLVGTGVEREIPRSSSMVYQADEDGVIEFADSTKIVLKGKKDTYTYSLRKFEGLNDRTCLNHVPIVKPGEQVTRGQVLCDGGGTKDAQLALGKNALVAFMPYDGCNFEDAIVVNERLLAEDMFTSIHIEEFKVEIRETKLGKEEFTREIPGRSDEALKNLDEMGVVKVGTMVRPGDVLVGKVTPKNKTELSPEEKLLHAIFGRAGEDVRDDSLTVKPGLKGVVVDVKRFRRRAALTDKDRKEEEARVAKIEARFRGMQADLVRQKFDGIWELAGEAEVVNTRTGTVIDYDTGMSDEDLLRLNKETPVGELNFVGGKRRRARDLYGTIDPKIDELNRDKEQEILACKRGDDLPTGVLEMVKVIVARKLTLRVGDKMAGRHGNKGVISTIVPEEDMPFLDGGQTIDILLNPLGVPSRMNVGQVMEVHLGYAARVLGIQTETPVFDGASDAEVEGLLKEAGLDDDGKSYLYDGRTGERLHQKTTVGVMYMLKLHHLVEDKLHARSTGSYSLITQQPLGGKARFGGQRFGEMEVWALEAYGAANVLQEILTVKSDDVDGRTRIYESMVKGDGSLTYGTPMAFEVLMNEIRGLCLDIRLHHKDDLGTGAGELTFDAVVGDAVLSEDGEEEEVLEDTLLVDDEDNAPLAYETLEDEE